MRCEHKFGADAWRRLAPFLSKLLVLCHGDGRRQFDVLGARLPGRRADTQRVLLTRLGLRLWLTILAMHVEGPLRPLRRQTKLSLVVWRWKRVDKHHARAHRRRPAEQPTAPVCADAKRATPARKEGAATSVLRCLYSTSAALANNRHGIHTLREYSTLRMNDAEDIFGQTAVDTSHTTARRA